MCVCSVGRVCSVNLASHTLGHGQVWCGSGCARGLCGISQHLVMARVYREFKLKHVTDRHNGTFQFGKWGDMVMYQ